MTKNNPYVAKGCSVLFPLMSCKAPNTTDGFRCAACHPGYTASADKKKCAVTKIITPGCSGYKETDGTTCAKGFKGYTCGAKSCTVTTPMVSCKVHVAFDGTKVKTASDICRRPKHLRNLFLTTLKFKVQRVQPGGYTNGKTVAGDQLACTLTTPIRACKTHSAADGRQCIAANPGWQVHKDACR